MLSIAFKIIVFHSYGINEACKICLVSCDCSLPWGEIGMNAIVVNSSFKVRNNNPLHQSGIDLWVDQSRNRSWKRVSAPCPCWLDFRGHKAKTVLGFKQKNSGSSTSSDGWRMGYIILWAVAKALWEKFYTVIFLWHILAYLKRNAWHISGICYLKWFWVVHVWCV